MQHSLWSTKAHGVISCLSQSIASYVTNTMPLGATLLRSSNLLWIALLRQCWIKKRAPVNRFPSVFVLSISCIILVTSFSQSQYVVLTGELGVNDWVFKKVLETLTPLGLRIFRLDYDVYVFPICTSTLCSDLIRLGIGLYQMVLYHSILTQSFPPSPKPPSFTKKRVYFRVTLDKCRLQSNLDRR